MLETNRPSATVRTQGTDVLHSPWMDGAMLHSPCPMVVTVHDVAEHKRHSQHLHPSLRLRLRPLAVQRAAGVIVPTAAVAEDAVALLRLDRERVTVIPEAADESMYAARPRRSPLCARGWVYPGAICCRSEASSTPSPGTRSGVWRPALAACRW